MLGISLLSILLLVELFSVAQASPSSQSRPGPKRCSRIRLRREWRDLAVSDKHGYIRAVRCLQTLPARDKNLPKKITRYEEFVVAHTAVADGIHGVAQFLPWHRHFGYLYETALRNECGYKGPIPFWDWPRDANGNKPLKDSPIFDTATGFGPDGTPGTFTMLPDNDPPPPGFDPSGSLYLPPQWNCVTSGPFANLTLHLGPGKSQNFEHCLTRAVQEEFRHLFKTSNIQRILGQKDYDSFWNSLDGRPSKAEWALHDGGHVTVSGDMTNYYTSPNEPIFYLHHGGLDHLWWKWQHSKPGRLYELNGRSSPIPPFGQITPDFVLPFGNLSATAVVGKTMDTSYEPYCYAYP